MANLDVIKMRWKYYPFFDMTDYREEEGDEALTEEEIRDLTDYQNDNRKIMQEKYEHDRSSTFMSSMAMVDPRHNGRYDGVTKRELFAMHIAAAFVSSGAYDTDRIARDSVEMSEALLRELDRENVGKP